MKISMIVMRQAPSTVNNTMFVGSAAELAKMLKDGFKEDPK